MLFTTLDSKIHHGHELPLMSTEDHVSFRNDFSQVVMLSWKKRILKKLIFSNFIRGYIKFGEVLDIRFVAIFVNVVAHCRNVM